MNKEFQICSNCVMDTSDPQIVFDANGVCDHCNTFINFTKPEWDSQLKNTKRNNNIIRGIEADGSGKDYNCILGMSGGIDSSYLLHLAVTEYQLKPLVFHVDAGWNSDIAVNNIEVLVKKLNLELYTEVINWNQIKDLQLSFFKSGVPHIDTPQDHAFFATMYKFASEHKIKHILTGANFSTECVRNPKSWMYFQSDATQIKDIHKKFGTRHINDFPLTSLLWHKIYLPYIKGIKVHKPLNFSNYYKQDAISVLKDLYGWQPYPQKHFESRFTRFYESYWLYEKFGYDTRKVQFSSLILTNQMKREDALKILKEKPYDELNIRHDFEYIASKLDISESDLMTFMSAPNKTYKDYRNQNYLYEAGKLVNNFLKIEAGQKR